jgi:hypothetical protein
MTSSRQDREFQSVIIGPLESIEFLSLAIDWIKNNLNPEDVFDEDQLKAWAVDYGYDEG